MALETGQRVGEYEVVGPLGVGGMGHVYKVRNIISNRDEAMKVLLPDFASDADLAARFMTEIRTVAGLEHPGIAQLRTAFQYQNQLVMVMEYVEGATLEKLAAQIRIPLDHVLDYTGQVLAALSYAHSRGVIHRDIKPANIMITTHGVVKLMDFGIAKSTDDLHLTRPGTTMGSVYYMSPEQVRGGNIDARSDLYSLGVTLYELLTGARPFQADTSYTILDAQLNKAPRPLIEVNPSIPPVLNDIVLRALAKRVEDRFQTADEFRDALRSAAHALQDPVQASAYTPVGSSQAQSTTYAPVQQTAPPPFVPVPQVAAPPTQPRSHRGLWIAVGAVAALLALVAVATVVPRMLSTHASPKQAATTANDTPATPPLAVPSEPAVTPANQPTIIPPPETSGATPAAPAVPTSQPVQTHAAGAAHAFPPKAMAGGQPVQPNPPTGVAPAPLAAPAATATPAAGPSAEELRAARDRMSELHARAEAATAQIQQLRAQQQAQGLDMRGDILAAMNRMHSNMNEARASLAEKDMAAATDYLNRAENNLAILEKFLGH